MNFSKKDIVILFFIILNISLIFILPLFTYKKIDNTAWWIFFLVFALILLISWFLFKQIEKFRLSTRSLILVQIGLILHYFGATKLFGIRGYNILIIGEIRFDKLVHFINSFIAFFVLNEWSRENKTIEGFGRKIWLILIVLGLGAIVEIIEYIAIQSTGSIVSQNLYDNNLQDLISNLAGATLASLLKNNDRK